MTAALQKLSLIIPAKDEAECIHDTVITLSQVLKQNPLDFEIIVVDDNSTDDTWTILKAVQDESPEIVPLKNTKASGFGNAVQFGLSNMTGDAVVIYMADQSDDPKDVLRYWQKLNEGFDCVFGSRFVKGGKTVDYPVTKFLLNRLTNKFIQLIFRIRLNDTTNAFKAYRKEVIEGCHPLLSPHFNLTVELPLKAIIRGYSWTVVPISWRNRKTGAAKFRYKEMGSRYIFIILYTWLEKFFSRGDYHKNRLVDSKSIDRAD